MSGYFEDPDRLLSKLGLHFMAEDGEKKYATNQDTSIETNQPANTQADTSGSASSHTRTAPTEKEAITCPVCYDDFPLDQTAALGCGDR